MNNSIIPKLAFDVLNKSAEFYKSHNSFSNEILEELHSVFGETFVLATELLEKCSIIQYQLEDGSRKVFKLIIPKEQFTIYNNLNFCTCQHFQYQVLESGNNVTCKHVLAVKLGIIMGNNVKVEIITGSQFIEFLNEQLCYISESE